MKYKNQHALLQVAGISLQKIHELFVRVVNTPGIYHQLNVPKNNVVQYRYKLKHNVHITIDKKLWILQRAGYRMESLQYTDADVADAIRFAIRASQATRNMGAEYVLEKWKAAKNDQNQ